MPSRASALVALTFFVACHADAPRADAGDAEAATDAAEAAARDAATDATDATDAQVAKTETKRDAASDDFAWLVDPRTARSIGHTSVVYKFELTNGKKAVFKPASRRGPIRYKGEIAAYRLGVALGLTAVPRAFYRRLDASVLERAALGSGAGETLFQTEVLRNMGYSPNSEVVKGALMPWIDDLDFLPLEREPLATEWKSWLRAGGDMPSDRLRLAAQISTLVAFDFVTGNWDRWSGGNVGVSKTTGDLIYLDNDGAFFEVVPESGLARNRRLLAGVDRFSRSFIAAIRALDDAALAEVIGDEHPGTPLLSEKALAGVSARRAALLAAIDAKAGDAGDAIYVFP